MNASQAPDNPDEGQTQHASEDAQALPEPKGNPDLYVVGIGASAGGLAALRSFFSAMPPDTGMTFVVIVHLSPEHESIMADLLQTNTEMPVTQVTSHVKMEQNHVYVIPPAKRLLARDGALELADFDMPRGHRVQIDVFFRSLAEQYGDGAAIILSGAGSDGSLGIQSIKERGGLILVQDPGEAEYDSMPRAAIATELVDIVAPVAELANKLIAAKEIGYQLEVPTDSDALPLDAKEALTQILAHLQVRTGHSLAGYKRSTLLRRITRRMQLAQRPTLSAYLQYLRNNVEEVDALHRDLLIHVTEFFRDPEAWEALAKDIIPRIFQNKDRNDQLRAWTVGCATGEEAYSLAMLLLEHAETLENPPAIQVFASDLGEGALDFARNGLYPEAIVTSVSEERLERYFSRQNSHYKVREELRDAVLFTPHNLLQDPPFSKLDLILCRNLLIYLQRPLQERVFETFHYALHRNADDGGYLFLGSAESPDGVTGLFETVDKRHHIYRRNRQQSEQLVLPTLSQVEQRNVQRVPSAVNNPQRIAEEHDRQAEIVGPASLLVDSQYRVLHLTNSVGRYLQHPDGLPTDEVFKLVRPELQRELRAALFRALEVGKGTLTRAVPVRFNGAPHLVSMLVRPSQPSNIPQHAVVFFLEDETPLEDMDGSESARFKADGEAASQQIQAELSQAQSQIQTLREEYETTVEELRAANEELQSTNEEYRSTLEELETSKEELQSINEELQTVNQQLQNKMEEAFRAHTDLQNLLTATEIATLFLDRNLRVKRYTPAAAELFNLMPPDVNRPISHLRGNLIYPSLEDDINGVLKSQMPVKREVQQEQVDGASGWLQVNIRPYRTQNDRTDGVVITFVDITESKESQLALQSSQERYRLLTENAQEYAIFMLNTEGYISDWNVGAENLFGYSEQEAIGMDCNMIYTEIDRANGVFSEEMKTAQKERQTADDRWHLRKDGSQFWASGIMVALTHPDGSMRGYAKLLRDNTERKEAEERLIDWNETLEERVRQRTQRVRELVTQLALSEQGERRRISQILHDDLQQRLYSLQFRLTSLRSDLDAELAVDTEKPFLKTLDEIEEALKDAIEETRNLSVSLSPPILKGEGLPESLTWLASQMDRLHGLAIDIEVEDGFPILDDDLRVLLIQVINELLFNVVKHAQVREAKVKLAHEDSFVRIEVMDHGVGFDSKTVLREPNQGRGLEGIRQRLEIVGATIEIESEPNNGSRVVMECPLSPSVD